MADTGPRLLLASQNEHKRREFQRLLDGCTVEIPSDEVVFPPESGTTYAENALIKAQAAATQAGRLAFADDSGIEANSLNWAPGVRSARFAGEQASDQENLELFISRVPPGDRIRYVCVVALFDPDSGSSWLFEGVCQGRMASQPSGSSGFGYDPIFIPESELTAELTMAQISGDHKDRISHRGAAAKKLLAFLSEKK